MISKLENVTLTEAQAVCLNAARKGAKTKNEIAILGKLNLKRTSGALAVLEELDLVWCDDRHQWHLTQPGKNIFFKTPPARIRRSHEDLGPSAQSIYNTLDHPIV